MENKTPSEREAAGESGHTPTPWMNVVLHPTCILGRGQRGNESFHIEPDAFTKLHSPKEAQRLAEANARKIVEAVNAHAGLVAENERLRAALVPARLDKLERVSASARGDNGHSEHTQVVLSQARAALEAGR